MLLMVNETRIYSDFQNLPYTTFINTLVGQGTLIVANLPAGKYEIKIGGSMLANTSTGERQITVGGQTVLSWNNSSEPIIDHQETTIEVIATTTLQIAITRPGTVDAPPLAYQIAYRSTPSLELITKAELYKKNQGLDEYFKEIEENKENAPNL